LSVERNQLPVLSRQLESLSHRAEVFQTREQEERDWFSAVLASLRSTHQLISSGTDPRGVVTDFVLEVSDGGKLLLKQAGLAVPVDDDYLVQVFATIGIDLAPGQFLLLDPQMAQWAIEESLWGLELERALSNGRGELHDTSFPSASVGAWSRKRDLVTANLIAEELLDVPQRRNKAV
jgi:hypothetical protein